MPKLSNIVFFFAAAFSAVSCNYNKIIEEETLGEYFRTPLPTSNIYADRVFEYTPAPGQFIGDPTTMESAILTPEAACKWAWERLASNKYVSLGGFGGYIVVGFDHSIVNLGDYCFAVYGNAVSGGSEPGIVWVSQDKNGNGVPDDEWYELRGSDTFSTNTIKNYSVTYFRPEGSGEDVRWSDSEGQEGTIDYLESFNSQDSYYPPWIDSDSYTLTGTRLAAYNYDQTGDGSYWVNPDYNWGYADNFGGTAFRIDDAIDSYGKQVILKYIDFIKVQTAVNAKSGRLGELSTEVTGFEDLSINLKP